MSKIKLSAVAIAAMTMFCGAANAQYYAASGSSALRATTLQLFANDCAGGAATIQVFQAVAAEGGSNVRAARCGATGGKTFSLDTDGGSYRAHAVLPANLAVINAQAAALGDPNVKPVRYLDLTLCPTAGGTLAAPVNCSAGAAKIVQASNAAEPKSVSMGLADVNPAFFDGLAGVGLGETLNIPNGFSGWKKITGANPSGPALGIVFGVAASRDLIQALMVDQGITQANSPTCWTNATTADLTIEACAPTISKDQYRSIASANFGQLNQSLANLFSGAVPATITAAGVHLERRDWGSGTQALTNNFFHGVGCSPYFLPPASASDSDGVSYFVRENNATGDVINNLKPAGTVALGVVSRENAASNGAGTAADAGWGFLKLGADKGAIYTALTGNAVANGVAVQGAYPNQNNAVRGLYDFWTVGWVHTNPAASADIKTLANNLLAGTGFTPGAGTFKLAQLTSGTNGLSTATVTTGTYYSKTDMSGACGGATSN
ncbi:MAG: hypothetical protein ABI605_02710 [Rhizobacter sp.]